MKVIVILSSLWLAGCATAYQSGTFAITGGYTDKPVTPKLQKVVFYANGYTDVATTENYALYRSGELALEKTKPYLVMYPSLNWAASNKYIARPITGSVDNKPAAYAYVLFSDVPLPGALKTSDVIAQKDASQTKLSEAKKAATKSTKKKKSLP